MSVMTNKCKSRREWVRDSGGNDAETVGNKSCVDSRNRQETGVGGA